MRLISDLHLHSKYARAVSRAMTPDVIAAHALTKGIDLVGTGDFTHPEWVAILERELEEHPGGFATLKGTDRPRFFFTCEISCIYSKGGKTRRIHLVLFAPNLKTVKEINARLGQIGNIKADGRPILGLDAEAAVKIVRESNPKAFVIPAHVWTPWFSLFGSNSGFNTVEECFGDETPNIFAIETGLSSDPPMNWRHSQLDRLQIVSFSDAHSAMNMGREATILELAEPTFANLRASLEKPTAENRVAATLEFFPEEGMYHWDGHRSHNLRLEPSETKKHKGICPVCHRPVTVGVLNRVDAIADRPMDYHPTNRPPFFSIIPLDEIIAEAFGVKSATKKVMAEYDTIVREIGTEFRALLEAPEPQLREVTLPDVASAIIRVRERKVEITPGYDGVYGTIKVMGDDRTGSDRGQARLL